MTRLRYEPIEIKECVQCHGTYEGTRCPLDGVPFDPLAARREAVPRLIVAGACPEVYVPELRLSCKNCGNLYELPREWWMDDPLTRWEAVRTTKRLLRSARGPAWRARAEGTTVRDLRARIKQALASLRCPLCHHAAPQRPIHVWQQQPPRRGARRQGEVR